MIAVLKEREDRLNNGSNLQISNEKSTIAHKNNHNRNKSKNKNKSISSNSSNNSICKKNDVKKSHPPTKNQVPSPRLSAMDISGILNCRRRLEWTKEWLRKNQHEFLNKENLQKDLIFRSNESYYLNHYFKITEKQFRYLVNILEPVVTNLKPQRKRKAFSAEERIAITLKYLATGEVNSCRNYCFLASKAVILKMIADICQKMYELLKDQYLIMPKRSEQWIPIINGMQQKHQLSNCLGHLLMQYITFKKPPSSRSSRGGSQWQQEAEDKSIVPNPTLILSAIVDDSYNFLYVDVEKTEAEFYEEVFQKSKIRKLLEDNSTAIPASVRKANGSCESCGFAGSSYFPQKTYLISPHKQMSEQEEKAFYNEGTNALFMLCNIFQVLSKPLRLGETDAINIILGTIALYNFLRKSDNDFAKNTEIIAKGREEQFRIVNASVENAQERKEHYEFIPLIQRSMCFKMLRKQTVGIPDGLEYY